MKKLFAGLLFVPMMAHAEFYTGNEVYMKLISEDNIPSRMVAMGYVAGVYDLGVYLFFCPPAREAGITVGQINDMVKNWLANNAHRRNELAHKLVLEAFKQAWPCQNKSGAPGRGA